MAELLIHMAVDFLYSAESPVLVDKSVSFRLKKILSYLEQVAIITTDLESRQFSNQEVKNWLISLKLAGYNILDELEKFKLQGHRVSFLNPRRPKFKEDVITEFENLLSKFENLLSNYDQLGLHKPELNQRMLDEYLIHPPRYPHYSIGGRDDECAALVEMLLNTVGQEGRIKYISIVGGVGTGKTALAQLVYENQNVKSHFHLLSWIGVPNNMSLSSTAGFLLSSFTGELVQDQLGLEILFQKIVHIISDKRFLFVLDNVWSKDCYVWEQLRNLFSFGAPGSTVLVTTRKMAVARAAGSRDAEDIYHLSPLSDRDCCSIVWNRASTILDRVSDPEKFFHEHGAVVAQRCLGVPLKAKILGDILVGRYSDIETWRSAIESSDPWSSEEYKQIFMKEEAEEEDEEQNLGFNFYAIRNEWENRARQPTTSLVPAATIHGRDGEQESLIAGFFDNAEAQVIRVISIVGKAGIGKTALAQLVFNSEHVRQHFDLMSWIYVSEIFNLKHIATAMLECFRLEPMHDLLELEILFQRIRHTIMGKRCLFVLDHVLCKINSKWEQLVNLVRYGAPGSTILITTRKEEVARAAGSNEADIVHLTNLSEMDCLLIIEDEASITSDPAVFSGDICRGITLKSRRMPYVAKYLCSVLRGRAVLGGQRQLLESYVPEPSKYEDPFMEGEKEPEEIERPPTTSVGTARIHGRDEERKTLLQMLLSQYGLTSKCISIFGRAGIGKTALAQIVYNDDMVLEYFDSRAWVYLGKEGDLKQILKAIMESLTSDRFIHTELEVLKQRFCEMVKFKRCLFVIDDVWLEDPHQWQDVMACFIFCVPGSKILITTRNERCAKSISPHRDIHRIGDLSEEACWSILKEYAFRRSVSKSEEEMFYKEVGKDIAIKCAGVPLVAKSIGSILRGKNTIQEWQKVLTGDVWHSTDLMSSLMLSYLSIPPELRQCLLYCSIFPTNHSIEADKLIKLWMAQGFLISSRVGNHYEMERGWEYLNYMIQRCIFQDLYQDGHGNLMCKLESGMSDLIHLLAKEESIILPIDYKKMLQESEQPQNNDDSPEYRHCTLSIVEQSSLPKSIANARKLHTLMILSEYFFPDPRSLVNLLSHLKMIRALSLSSCLIKELPSKVGELLFLRYLDLSFNRDLKKLPKSICSLLNLQTLNLNGCDSLRKLPKDIGKLIKLWHLEILWTTSLSYLPKGVASLIFLRTLSRFIGSSAAGSKACNLGDLGMLNNIEGSITIDGLGGKTSTSEASKAGLKNKKGLQGLELCFSAVGSTSTEDECVLKVLEAPPQLQCLQILFYRGELFPAWMTAMQCLRHLMLAHCSECEYLPPLGQLRALESLEIKDMPKVKTMASEFLGVSLDNADRGEEGPSSIVAFPSLKALRFETLNGWEEWFSDDDTNVEVMPLLLSLVIENCPNLRELPEYIRVKQNLKLDIKKCPPLEATSANAGQD
ncbi:hypothetical protein PIB30_070488 [Stylosanthes scabra]|uniref:Uncharacterized protein n=1 Tax=Stylosanthes scabra TaxID=79078 RepID=A0ABU6ZMA4_9FABA|nr:hypothetical protein [Stylosanthes scabra]